MKDFQLRFMTNKETIRWLKILNAFERSANRSTKELAQLTSSTTRTIVADITAIREVFADKLLIEATSVGYMTTKQSHLDYIDQKRTLLADEPLFKVLEGIFYHEIKSLGEWAEQLHISESSLIRYFKHVQKELSPYGIALTVNPVDLIGDEAAIRCFFHDFYYESEITPHTIQPSLAVQQLAFDLKKEHFFSTYPNISLGDFTYTVYITLERYLNGCKINLTSSYLQRMTTQDSFRSFQKINPLIEEKFETVLPETEILFLYILLMSRRSLTDEAGEALFVAENQPTESITTAADRFLSEVETQSPNKQRDQMFIRSFFTMLFIRESLTPAANQTIRDVHETVAAKFPAQFAQYLAFFDRYGASITGGKTSAENCTVLMVLYMDALKEIHWGQFQRIAFLLEGNAIVCQNIQATAIKYLGRFQNVYFPNAIALDQAYIDRHQIDLVVTNYSEYMNDLLKNQRALLFQTIPDANDWNRLLREINTRIVKEFSLKDTPIS
ncbi:helix-turn-helix domain-containing protein [Candidatus Enterococcus testudinis]|nr:helix-turn-helix domain-containing protein [Enterococcus sp. 8G7_MSG3316]